MSEQAEFSLPACGGCTACPLCRPKVAEAAEAAGMEFLHVLLIADQAQRNVLLRLVELKTESATRSEKRRQERALASLREKKAKSLKNRSNQNRSAVKGDSCAPAFAPAGLPEVVVVPTNNITRARQVLAEAGVLEQLAPLSLLAPLLLEA